MERLFLIIQTVTIAVFFLIGAALYRMGAENLLLDSRASPRAVQTTFIMEEERPQKKVEPPRPVVERKRDDEPPVETMKQETPPPRERQVRQVFGLRKVFSQGLGEGGDGGDAIVGRIGNTLDATADTSAATADDLRGRSVADPRPQPTVPPRLDARFRRLRPQYSEAMLQNRVEGVVRARLLVGSDGSVRRVEILEDIGFDSADIAREFLMNLKFTPATRGAESVSVWIPFSIRFELVS